LNNLQDLIFNLGLIKLELLIAAGVFILFMLVSFLASLLARWINNSFCKHSLTPVISIKFVRWIFIIWGILAGLHIIHTGFTSHDIYSYESFFKLVGDLTFIAAVLYITILAYKFVYYAIEKYIRKEKGHTDRNITSLVSKVLKLMFTLVALILVLDHYSININSFVVSLGIGSFAIAFAAQETLSNFISGVVILIDRPFIIGDTIKTSSGSVGKVEYIGLRACTIITLEDKYLIVPNSDLTKSSIINYRNQRDKFKIRFNFFIPYTYNLDEFKDTLLGRIKNSDLIMDDPAPSFIYQSMALEEFEITIVCFTEAYANDTNASNFVKESVYKLLNEFENKKDSAEDDKKGTSRSETEDVSNDMESDKPIQKNAGKEDKADDKNSISR
jgi:small conductance mechanosensitive channel